MSWHQKEQHQGSRPTVHFNLRFYTTIRGFTWDRVYLLVLIFKISRFVFKPFPIPNHNVYLLSNDILEDTAFLRRRKMYRTRRVMTRRRVGRLRPAASFTAYLNPIYLKIKDKNNIWKTYTILTLVTNLIRCCLRTKCLVFV